MLTMALPTGSSLWAKSKPPLLYVLKWNPTRSRCPISADNFKYESTVGKVNGITVSNWNIQLQILY